MKQGNKGTGKAAHTKETPAKRPRPTAIPFPPGLWFNLAEEAQSVPHFTIREKHVGGWMAEGKTDAEIADILPLGIQTVKTHVKSLLFKTGTENRNAFVAWVWRDRIAAELAPPPPRKAVKYT